MNNIDFLIHTRKVADVNLQLIETLLQLDNQDSFVITDELREMLEFVLEQNWQQYRLTNENLQENGYVL
jgi:hypothetical protein